MAKDDRMKLDQKMRLEELKMRKIKLEHERPVADELQMRKEKAERIFGKEEEKRMIEIKEKIAKIEAIKARESGMEVDESLQTAYAEMVEQLKNLEDRKIESEQVFNMDDKKRLESYRNYEAITKKMEEELSVGGNLGKKDKASRDNDER